MKNYTVYRPTLNLQVSRWPSACL